MRMTTVGILTFCDRRQTGLRQAARGLADLVPETILCRIFNLILADDPRGNEDVEIAAPTRYPGIPR
jgi:hypothetical protein